jgi:hypothetical protein
MFDIQKGIEQHEQITTADRPSADEQCKWKLEQHKCKLRVTDLKIRPPGLRRVVSESAISVPKNLEPFSPTRNTVEHQEVEGYDHEAHESRVQELLNELQKFNIYDTATASTATLERGGTTAHKYAFLYEEELRKMLETAKVQTDVLGRPPHPNQLGGETFC